MCSFQYHRGELRLYDVTFENAGMYQCIAENTHGAIYANAELKILGQYHFLFLSTINKKATLKSILGYLVYLISYYFLELIVS